MSAASIVRGSPWRTHEAHRRRATAPPRRIPGFRLPLRSERRNPLSALLTESALFSRGRAEQTEAHAHQSIARAVSHDSDGGFGLSVTDAVPVADVRRGQHVGDNAQSRFDPLPGGARTLSRLLRQEILFSDRSRFCLIGVVAMRRVSVCVGFQSEMNGPEVSHSGRYPRHCPQKIYTIAAGQPMSPACCAFKSPHTDIEAG